MGERRNAYKILVGKPERKRPLGIPLQKNYLSLILRIGKITAICKSFLLMFHSVCKCQSYR
jgi:hypothetical protein